MSKGTGDVQTGIIIAPHRVSFNAPSLRGVNSAGTVTQKIIHMT